MTLSEQTPMGISAQDVIDRIAGSMEGELEWFGDGEGYVLTLSASTNTVPVTIEITYDDGSITYLEQEQIVPEGAVNDSELVCPDRLGIDVRFALTTEDGTLSETLSSTLVVDADPLTGEPGEPSLGVDLPFAMLSGTIAITGIEPSSWSVSESLRILASLPDGRSTGQLQAAVTDPDGGVRMAEFGAWQATTP